MCVSVSVFSVLQVNIAQIYMVTSPCLMPHASCLLSNRLTITDMGTWAGIGERGFEFGTLGGQPKHKETLSEQQP